MKKLFFFALVVLCFAVTSCNPFSLESKINRLADKVEAKGSDFSSEQWDKVIDDFEDLVYEYYNDIEKYKPSEQKKIVAAITRFVSVSVEAGYDGLSDQFSDLVDDLPGALNDLIDGAKDFLDDLKF